MIFEDRYTRKTWIDFDEMHVICLALVMLSHSIL